MVSHQWPECHPDPMPQGAISPLEAFCSLPKMKTSSGQITRGFSTLKADLVGRVDAAIGVC